MVWTTEEDHAILRFVRESGHKWFLLKQRYLPTRTEHAIRNRFHRLQTIAQEDEGAAGALSEGAANVRMDPAHLNQLAPAAAPAAVATAVVSHFSSSSAAAVAAAPSTAASAATATAVAIVTGPGKATSAAARPARSSAGSSATPSSRGRTSSCSR